MYPSLPLHKLDCTGLTFNIFNRCQAESLRPAKLSTENVKPSTQQDLFPQLFPIRDSLRSFLWYSLSSSLFDTNEWFALLGVWRRLTQRWNKSSSSRSVVEFCAGAFQNPHVLFNSCFCVLPVTVLTFSVRISVSP